MSVASNFSRRDSFLNIHATTLRTTSNPRRNIEQPDYPLTLDIMPPKSTALTPKQKRQNRNELAKKLAAAALKEESGSEEEEEEQSDEETGHWERIYEEKNTNTGRGKTSTKRPERNIIGARRREDGLECKIGDCVLLKAGSGSVPWVGMIMQFVGLDNDGDECANFLCNCSPCYIGPRTDD